MESTRSAASIRLVSSRPRSTSESSRRSIVADGIHAAAVLRLEEARLHAEGLGEVAVLTGQATEVLQQTAEALAVRRLIGGDVSLLQRLAVLARSLECTRSPVRRRPWPTRVVPANTSQADATGSPRAMRLDGGHEDALGADVLDQDGEDRRRRGRSGSPPQTGDSSAHAEATNGNRAPIDIMETPRRRPGSPIRHSGFLQAITTASP